jgi:hypothetical protein
LKRLSPLQSRVSALSDKSSDKPMESSESVAEDEPVTPKSSDKSSDKPMESSESVAEDEPVTPKSSDKSSDKPMESSESVVEDAPPAPKLSDKSSDKPMESSESVAEDESVTPKSSDKSSDKPRGISQNDTDDTVLISESSGESKEPSLDVAKQDTDNTPKSSGSPDKSSEIQFDNASDGEDDKPATYARRPPFENLHDKASILTFKNKKTEKPPQKNPDTGILPKQSPAWKKVIDAQAQGTTGTIGDQREVLFVIRGMIERIVMKDNAIVTMGRFDTGTVPNEEIDLIPYGAIDRGVSRRHCKILLRDNQLHVVDLGSTNGTFLAGVRLNPDEPVTLRKGDELLLGRLAVQVLFR